VVGQIAKLKGATVLGIAGSDDKCRWLTEELGFDSALNYKATDFVKQFRDATKDLIDLYFDNGEFPPRPKAEGSHADRGQCSWWRDP
jgi:NADPH-dependent curcumin reductase CurA